MSSDSSGVAGLTGVRPSSRCVSLGSLECALAVVGFIQRVPCGSSGASGDTGLTGVRTWSRPVHPHRWVHWDAPWGSSGSSGIARFTGMRPGVRRGQWFHWSERWRSPESFGIVSFIRVCLGGRRIHSGSQGSLGCALGFIRVRWVHWGAL